MTVAMPVEDVGPEDGFGVDEGGKEGESSEEGFGVHRGVAVGWPLVDETRTRGLYSRVDKHRYRC